jgi:hypothetical protein
LDNNNFKDTTGDNVNILREKTFNKNLKNLVNRIKDNELIQEHDNIDNLSENELIVELHKLFYKTKNLSSIDNINNEFNLSRIDEKSLDEFIIDKITSKLNKFEISSFAILPYQINKKSFSPSFSTFSNIKSEDIVISLRDKLYNEIDKKNHGVLLTPKEITEDPFYSKKFSTHGKSDYFLYFIFINRLTEKIYFDIDRDLEESWNNKSPSPILMLMISEDKRKNTDKIYSFLNEKLPLHLFLLNDNSYINYSTNDFKDISNIMLITDYFLHLFFKDENDFGILISCKNCEAIEPLLLIKYLHARIKSILKNDSYLIRLRADRLFILTDEKNREEIAEIVTEYNSVCTPIFETLMVSFSDMGNFNYILKNTLY